VIWLTSTSGSGGTREFRTRRPILARVHLGSLGNHSFYLDEADRN
jgi:hypothetical protein